MQQALQILNSVFGYGSFRGRQADIISHAQKGGSCLVLMPTGGGKSLCYQIPAMTRPGLGLVISPLIALMHDQVGALKVNGARAEFYNSTMDLPEKQRVRNMARSGELDLLYVAPETLNSEAFASFLDGLELSLIAVDEAHCVSQWGHDFRPDYLQIAGLRTKFPEVPLMALTATADEATRREILSRLGLEGSPTFASSFDRPNIRYQVALKEGSGGKEQLLEFIKAGHSGEAGIVYCLSRKKVEETAEWLSARGIAALPYHAGLDAGMRRRHQERFLSEEGVVIVATIAFGMGIDKPNVRFVAHLDLPKSVESYYQETGRAGRDGEPAEAWMAYGLGDVVQLRQMILQSEGSEEYKRLSQAKLNAMLGFCETLRCRRQALLAYFSEEHPGSCANCDTCLNPPRTVDGSEASQKALSAVARSGERFGAGHLIDLLLGKETEKVLRFGHHQLSVFGVGKERDEKRWSAVFRQLISLDYLSVDTEGFGALKLNERSWRVLKGQEKVALREDPPARLQRSASKSGPAAVLHGDDAQAFEALRALRLRLAKEQDLPPYVVFHDAALREMVTRRPANLAEFARVPGVGQAKLARYGEEFLACIRESFGQSAATAVAPPAGAMKPKVRNESQDETLRLFRQGKPAPAIAAQRNLSVVTIYDHFAQLIADGLLSREEVLDLSADEISAIEAALAEGEGRMKPAFEKFSGKYSYDVIKCVRAGAGLQRREMTPNSTL